MSKLLAENARPDGVTELTLDLNGVQVVKLSVLTIYRHTIGEEFLDDFILHILHNVSVNANPPPV